MSLRVGALSNVPNIIQEDRYDKCAKGLPKTLIPGWHANLSALHCDTLILTNLPLATLGPLNRALDLQ